MPVAASLLDGDRRRRPVAVEGVSDNEMVLFREMVERPSAALVLARR
jgi:hypothetical protein